VDAITGPAMGRPKSATFRLGDIVGVDLMVQMGRNLQGLLKTDEEMELFRLRTSSRRWSGGASGVKKRAKVSTSG